MKYVLISQRAYIQSLKFEVYTHEYTPAPKNHKGQTWIKKDNFIPGLAFWYTKVGKLYEVNIEHEKSGIPVISGYATNFINTLFDDTVMLFKQVRWDISASKISRSQSHKRVYNLLRAS